MKLKMAGLAIVLALLCGCADVRTLAGYVYPALKAHPAGVYQVSWTRGGGVTKTAMTDATGGVGLYLVAGADYTITVERAGFQTQTRQIVATEDEIVFWMQIEGATATPTPTITPTSTPRPTWTPTASATATRTSVPKTGTPTRTLIPKTGTATATCKPTLHVPTPRIRVEIDGELFEVVLLPVPPTVPWFTATPSKTATRTATPAPTATATPDNLASWRYLIYGAGDNNLGRYLDQARQELLATSLPDGVIWAMALDTTDHGTAIYSCGLDRVGRVSDWPNDQQGEWDTGDGDTLSAFLDWADANAPARQTYLAISDHGSGYLGCCWDDASGGDHLTFSEIRYALGGHEVDLLHFDACLMASMEAAWAVRDRCDYLIASSNLAWSYFAYDQYVQVRGDAEARAVGIAGTYYRALSSSYPGTISVLDMAEIDGALDTVGAIAAAGLESADLRGIQRYDTAVEFGILDQQDRLLDLFGLADVAGVDAAPLQQLVIYEAHKSGKMYGASVDLSESRGLSIHRPAAQDRAWQDYADEPTIKDFLNVTGWGAQIPAALDVERMSSGWVTVPPMGIVGED